MPARIAFERVSLRAFRNIEHCEIEPAARLNVIVGANGQGKTSLLEALYVLATSKSFRTEHVAEAIGAGHEAAVARADIVEDGQRREQRAVLDGTRRALTIDGKRPPSLTSFATRTPIVAFHPGDLTLVSGPASGRRLLLDRLALHLAPTSADDRARYGRATRERQRALELRGPSASDVEPYEGLMSIHGAALQRARREASERVVEHLVPAFESVAPSGVGIRARFVPGGTEDVEEFLEELAARRGTDLRRRSASFGPQKDDLEFDLDGRSARRHASQGQQRLLTLALKSAELAGIRDARGAHPVLLLDDFSSELDSERTGAVYAFITGTESQVFVTTTRAELFPEDRRLDRADWTVSRGVVARVS